MLKRSLVILSLTLPALACLSVQDELVDVDRPLLFTGGRVYAHAAAEPVEALVTRNGWVVALGSTAELTQDHPDAEVIDLAGATVLPGLQDAHGHIEGYGRGLGEVDLRGAASYEEAIERIAARADSVPAGTWITGRGWDQNLWPGKAFPHHAALSERVPAHPVFVNRVDGHAALANGRALELAGLGGALDPVPRIEGGAVIVDERGEATGVLIDTAMSFVAKVIPEPSREERKADILRAQESLLAKGLTCVHDMGVDRETIRIYEELRRDQQLRMRVVAYLWGNGLQSPEELDGLPIHPDAEDRLSVRGSKLMADGALGSRGAALLDDYHDAPGERGLLRFEDAEDFERVVRMLMDAGLQPATHAIGDRANRMVLDTYEKVMAESDDRRYLRPRIEHAQIVAPEDWPRFAELGIVPSMQPTHCTSDMGWVPDRLGPERPAGAYAWKKLATSARAPLAFGSDFPVERPDPLEGVFAAVTRIPASRATEAAFYPDQRLSAAEAIAAFTEGAAYASFQEARRGRLAPGFGCDMTVVDRDPLALGADEAGALLETRVLMTVVQGEIVYRAEP